MIKVRVIGKGLVTPVGNTPEEVFQAAREGRSALRMHEGFPEPYFASLLDRDAFEGKSLFQAAAIKAARAAIADAGIDPAAPDTGFVLSTIKGEVERIDSEDVSLAKTAADVAAALGVTTQPLVVSNACISGLAALVQGMRMIRAGQYRKVIVCGAEIQSPFIVTGFQSLKALSLKPCRPFDAAREGLNLGEAAAAVVLSDCDDMALCDYDGAERRRGAGGIAPQFVEDKMAPWTLVQGAIRNDANHISGPSRTGEGSFNALQAVLPHVKKEDLAFVNVHGTATLYNDEMEAIALQRAGLLDVPINSMKGVFGHTMGAAGLLESILSMQALEEGIVLPTRGFETLGVSAPVSVSAHERKAQGNAFIKLLSGFGGVNGALLFRKGGAL